MSDPQVQNFQAPPPPPKVEAPAPRPIKMRPVAIALFVIGLLVLVGGIAKFIPGGAGTGAAVAFSGILIFALSFIPLPQVPESEPPLSPVGRALGIFYEPSRVFRNLRAHPRWLAAFAIICVMSIAYSTAFQKRLTPERIVNYTIDKVAESGFMPADRVDAAREQQLEDAKNPVQRVGAAIKSVVGILVLFVVLAALFLLLILAFGGRINFWQAFAVTLYASLPVVVIQKAISLIILYIKSPDDIHPILGQETLVQDNLGVLFAPATHPVLFVLGTAIGFLSFYRLWLTAKGLHYAGTKVSSGAGWGASITLFLLSLVLGAIFASLFSAFMS
jgi:multisubunit Na+/H+ antiporter MnhB subunit